MRYEFEHERRQGDVYKSPLFKSIQRLMLCQNVVKQAHEELEPPLDSDARADLLIAVESLALETIDLLHTTRAIVWGDPLPYPSSQGLEEEEDDD